MAKGIIAILGLRGSGKSYAAGLLHRALGASKIRSFADPIREAARLVGYTEKEMTDPARKDKPSNLGPSFRSFAVWYGQGMKSLFGKDVWVKQLSRAVAEDSKTETVIIDDLRFREEAEWVLSQSSVILVIWTPDEAHPISELPEDQAHVVITRDWLVREHPDRVLSYRNDGSDEFRQMLYSDLTDICFRISPFYD
jgi:hypothetical protein